MEPQEHEHRGQDRMNPEQRRLLLSTPQRTSIEPAGHHRQYEDQAENSRFIDPQSHAANPSQSRTCRLAYPSFLMRAAGAPLPAIHPRFRAAHRAGDHPVLEQPAL
ncbi:hypothetical protein D3C83_18890 [compost metagenome]